MLTGKAKEQFEDWYFRNYVATKDKDINDILDDDFYINSFFGYPLPLQWGVIQDFGLTVWGYNILTSWNPEDKSFMWLITKGNKDEVFEFNEFTDSKTRHEARTAAIEKLNQLINEK